MTCIWCGETQACIDFLERIFGPCSCRDSDGTATAALCEDIAVPQDCQARAESIAQRKP
jgi:hypothetical protein